MIAIFKQSRIVAAAAFVFGLMTMGAHPALANSSAASADMAAAARDARTAPISGGDEQFRNLFTSWGSPNGDVATSPVPASTIAIPSIMPLAAAKLTSNYGMRTHPVIGGRRNHQGVDLAAPTGTPVLATADGIVPAPIIIAATACISRSSTAQLSKRVMPICPAWQLPPDSG